MAQVTTNHETIRNWAERRRSRRAASRPQTRQCREGRVMPSLRILR